MVKRIDRTDDEWRALLTREQFRVLRRSGTEAPFSGEYSDLEDAGTYSCAGCGNPVFSSQAKYRSECGWPSFFAPITEDAVTEYVDAGFGMIRME
ncbi:MAG: peptide-methionine (R)-S-oxide reductase, partial [Coriobacteriia bacterium]|nr:peptide-methionine (R)-S-oxide reductase [Coriobacteriia bacterium]